MEIALGMFLCVGSIFDIWKRRVPNLLAVLTLGILLVLLSHEGEGILLKRRLIESVGIYIVFFWCYRFGLFGGGDGKAAALMTMALGLEAFFMSLFFGSIIGIMIAFIKRIAEGNCPVMKNLKTIFQTAWKFGLSAPALIKLEVRSGKRLPFLPYLLGGYLAYLSFFGGI